MIFHFVFLPSINRVSKQRGQQCQPRGLSANTAKEKASAIAEVVGYGTANLSGKTLAYQDVNMASVQLVVAGVIRRRAAGRTTDKSIGSFHS